MIRVHRSLQVALRAIPALLLAFAVQAATPLLNPTLGVSADVTVDLSGAVLADEAAVGDDLPGGLTPLVLPSIPANADLVALGSPHTSNLLIMAVDTTIELPGKYFPITVRPGDVVRYTGSYYIVIFDAGAAGVPPGARVDAVAARGTGLLLSFDVTVDLGGGLVADDEDVVLWTGGTSFAPFFDGSGAGVPGGLDVDGVEWLYNDHLLVSFDGSGSIGLLDFDGADVLETDRISTWEMVYDGSAEHAGWAGGPDLDAVVIVPEPDALLSLGAGVALACALDRRRRARRG